MKLVKCELNELNLTFKSSKNHKLLIEFMQSGMDCAEIRDYNHVSADSCANAFNASIKTYGLSGVKATQRGDKVYLIRK